MTDAPILYQCEGAIATITLNRPQAHNALTPQMLCLLADAFESFRNDASLRVAILTGTGDRAFCAGGDLALTLPLLTGDRAPADAWDQRVLDDPIVMRASSLRDYPLDKPVIAALNGPCFAAGSELLLGTDLRIAAEHATIAFPEVRRALIPFAGSLVRLARQIPYAQAMEMLLTGEPVDAQQALNRGLVNRVVPGDTLQAVALAMARAIAGHGPLAVAQIKRTVRDTSGMDLSAAHAIEDAAWQTVRASEDAREGPRAFMEKRPPRFTGH